MRVGWLHDDPGYMGGAELTMEEFKAAAPKGVAIVGCPPGNVRLGLDRYVVGNCLSYSVDEIDPIRIACVRYHHDVTLAEADLMLGLSASHIFCSPLQRERMRLDDLEGLESTCIPPALDLDRFKRYANQNHRTGAVCIGRMAYGKGVHLLAEYSEPVDVFSSVPLESDRNMHYQGATSDVAKTLSHYERFVFLPTALEPFGRAVVEAWAAGLKLVLNRNVGARYWIEENPDGLATAADDFWAYVTA